VQLFVSKYISLPATFVNHQLTKPVALICRGSYGRAGECGSWPHRWMKFGKMTGFLAKFAGSARATDMLTQSESNHGPTLAQPDRDLE
jgi:hypothetical protein